MILARFSRLLPILAALLPAALYAAEADRPLSINVDMTAEGRKVERPTPAKPAYYFPVVGGYRELGSKISGETPPDPKAMIHDLAKTLAAQGYIASKAAPPDPANPNALKLAPLPSLVLVFNWGYLNPVTADFSDPTDPQPPTVLNQNKMLALIGGKGADNLDPNFTDFTDMMADLQDNHFFVIVAAYDFDAYMKRHKRVQLWTARISIDSPGLAMPDVMPQLVTAGGPYFGHETYKPVTVNAPVGRVEAGELEVKGYIAPGATTPPPAKK